MRPACSGVVGSTLGQCRCVALLATACPLSPGSRSNASQNHSIAGGGSGQKGQGGVGSVLSGRGQCVQMVSEEGKNKAEHTSGKTDAFPALPCVAPRGSHTHASTTTLRQRDWGWEVVPGKLQRLAGLRLHSGYWHCPWTGAQYHLITKRTPNPPVPGLAEGEGRSMQAGQAQGFPAEEGSDRPGPGMPAGREVGCKGRPSTR